MGQQSSSISEANRLYEMPLPQYILKERINSALAIWKRKSPPNEQLIECRMVVNTQEQLKQIYDIFKMRHIHVYLPATRYLTCDLHGIKRCGGYYKGNIYVQSTIATLLMINDIPFYDSLHLYSVALKGFDILYKQFGYFDVFEDMFHICQNGKVKVWCNSQVYKLKPQPYLLDQTGKQDDMVFRVINLIDQNVDKSEKLNIKRQLYKKIPPNSHFRTFQQCNIVFRQLCKQYGWQPSQRLKCISQLTKQDIEKLLQLQQNQQQLNKQIYGYDNVATANTIQHETVNRFGNDGKTSLRLSPRNQLFNQKFQTDNYKPSIENINLSNTVRHKLSDRTHINNLISHANFIQQSNYTPTSPNIPSSLTRHNTQPFLTLRPPPPKPFIRNTFQVISPPHNMRVLSNQKPQQHNFHAHNPNCGFSPNKSLQYIKSAQIQPNTNQQQNILKRNNHMNVQPTVPVNWLPKDPPIKYAPPQPSFNIISRPTQGMTKPIRTMPIHQPQIQFSTSTSRQKPRVNSPTQIHANINYFVPMPKQVKRIIPKPVDNRPLNGIIKTPRSIQKEFLYNIIQPSQSTNINKKQPTSYLIRNDIKRQNQIRQYLTNSNSNDKKILKSVILPDAPDHKKLNAQTKSNKSTDKINENKFLVSQQVISNIVINSRPSSISKHAFQQKFQESIEPQQPTNPFQLILNGHFQRNNERMGQTMKEKQQNLNDKKRIEYLQQRQQYTDPKLIQMLSTNQKSNITINPTFNFTLKNQLINSNQNNDFSSRNRNAGVSGNQLFFSFNQSAKKSYPDFRQAHKNSLQNSHNTNMKVNQTQEIVINSQSSLTTMRKYEAAIDQQIWRDLIQLKRNRNIN